MDGDAGRAPTDDERRHAQLVSDVVAPLVGSLCRALGPRSEVILSDQTEEPGVVVAVAGTISGLAVGDRITTPFAGTPSSRAEEVVDERLTTPAGAEVRFTRLLFRAATGRVVMALHIMSDVTQILRAQQVIAGLSSPLASGAEQHGPKESFPKSVELLAQGVLEDAIRSTGVRVDLMKKAHKLAVVRELNERGFFGLRESADLAARALNVSRFSVYNYLNELQNAADESSAS